jgi:hypothetical protein
MKTERRTMRMGKGCALFGILLLAAAAAGLGQGGQPAAKRLLRMENLAPRNRPPAAAQRDIFSPGGYAPSAVSASAGRAVPGRPGGAEEAVELEEPPRPAFSLRFIGYSHNSQLDRTVGLILLDGVARAVGEGDVLPNGLEIVRVTREQIEARKPDGEILTFSLEGDKR